MEKIVASGLVIIKDDKLLLANDGKDNFYKIPGGKPLSGESLEECALRELKEETGFVGIVLDKLPTKKLTKKPQTGEEIDVFLYHFRGDLKDWSGTTKDFDFNGHHLVWAELNKIHSGFIEVAPNVKFLLEYL